MGKRFLSVLLCLAMLLGLTPTNVWAEAGAAAPAAVREAQQGEAAPVAAETPEQTITAETPEGIAPAVGEKAQEAVLAGAGGSRDPISADAPEPADGGAAMHTGAAALAENTVAEVTAGGSVTAYSDLTEAFAAAQAAAQATVKLVGDVSFGSNQITLSFGEITFDLNGCTLECSLEEQDKSVISVGNRNSAVTLTVCDTGAAQSGKIVNTCREAYTPMIDVKGRNCTLQVTGGTLETKKNSTPSAMAAVIHSQDGTVLVTGGSIRGSCYGIAVESAGLLRVSGDPRIHGNRAAVADYSGGLVRLSGGTYSTRDGSSQAQTFYSPGVSSIGALLAEGYLFVDENGVKIDSATAPTGFQTTVTVKENQAAPVNYIDADGKVAQCDDYTALITDPTDGKLADGQWYVIAGQWNPQTDWTVSGNVNLILADDAQVHFDELCLLYEEGASLTVYGQEKGTGRLSLSGSREMVYPIGGEHTVGLTLGSLTLYGGTVQSTATKARAASFSSLAVYGGTLIASAPEGEYAIYTRDRTCTLGAGMKLVETDNPQKKAYYNNMKGISVTATRCDDHIWQYESSETAGMHKQVCQLCGSETEEAHSYRFPTEQSDETGHILKCVCGAYATQAEAHTMAYLPNDGGKTHRYACSVCGYEDSAKGGAHDFTAEESVCAQCGYTRAASVIVGETEYNFATVREAVDLAGAKGNEGSVITLRRDCDGQAFGVERGTMKVNFGQFTIDFNRHTLQTGQGDTAFVIDREADVTLKNGSIDVCRTTTLSDQAAVYVQSGALTLENFTVRAGYAMLPGGTEPVQYPAVKVTSIDGVYRGRLTMQGENVLEGGLEIDRYARINRLTAGRFCYDSVLAGRSPVLKLGGRTVLSLLADGYTLAKDGHPEELICLYDKDGNALSEFYEAVTVVPHPKHSFVDGVCACGLRCGHTGGL